MFILAHNDNFVFDNFCNTGRFGHKTVILVVIIAITSFKCLSGTKIIFSLSSQFPPRYNYGHRNNRCHVDESWSSTFENYWFESLESPLTWIFYFQ